MAQKRRWLATVTQECRYGGRAVEYWIWAMSEAQAQRSARIRYNKERKRVPEAYVEMQIKEVPVRTPRR